MSGLYGVATLALVSVGGLGEVTLGDVLAILGSLLLVVAGTAA
ncbi:hypothetical protein [Halostella pelagica]|nr:hypothetical protein [Halostella pelagica]